MLIPGIIWAHQLPSSLTPPLVTTWRMLHVSKESPDHLPPSQINFSANVIIPRLTSATVRGPRHRLLTTPNGLLRVGLDPDPGLIHLRLVHNHVGVLGPGEDVVDADDGLLLVILGVTHQSCAHLHPGVASATVEEPEVG